MTRKPANAQRSQTRRTRPGLEGLEDRRLLSIDSLHHSIAAVPASNGTFSHNDREFTYTTPTAGRAVIDVVGRGSLAGTTVDSAGALHLAYGGTNTFSKIVGKVQGGSGRAPLASIRSGQVTGGGAQLNVSGIGSSVIQAVLLRDFDLVGGGNINLTAGVNSVVLDSVGPNTQIHLRQLPNAIQPSVIQAAIQANKTSGGSSSGSTSRGSSAASGSTSTVPLQQTGVPFTNTSSEGVTTTYVKSSSGAVKLTAVGGSFTAGSNIVQSLPPGQPPQTIPPAPPGVIFKANEITGTPTAPINLLTDSKIFGYDALTGRLVRFNLDLTTDTGAPDPTFAPISVPGHPAVAGVNLGRDASHLDVLVSSGTTVYAYNATTGAPVGSFTTSNVINSIGSTENLTVLGSYQTNHLQAIDLTASLQTGHVQPAAGNPQPLTPMPEVTLLGGLTGLPGSNTVYATVAAHFNSFQPDQTQLGIQSVSTVTAAKNPGRGSGLSNQLTTVALTAIQQFGTFINVVPNALIPGQPGPALGSVDQSLALVTGASSGTNTVNLYAPSPLSSSGTITLKYPDQLAGLSEAFRPDLTGSALIDIQGDVQSIRGGSATGMVLNDTGNLNVVKFVSVTNSTIVGQPVGHLQITNRSNVTILTPSRKVDGRNGVTVNSGLDPIGPLSQPND